MSRTQIVFLLMALALGMVSCSERGRVRLEIDFSGRSQWQYRMHVEINGSIERADSLRHFSSSARCYLRGSASPDDPSVLDFTVSDVEIASDIMSAAEIHNLTRQFEGIEMGFSCRHGAIWVVDTSSFPVIHIGEWDLFRTFARVIPSIPGSKIKAGASWDRERQIPLHSAHGDAIGHLYQSFSLDSLCVDDEEQTMAYISWEFSYRVEILQSDSLGLLDGVPLMGDGKGHATFNVSGKYLNGSHISFSVRRRHQTSINISWTEEVDLVLED